MQFEHEVITKADRRAARKRPRMKVHGASLKRPSKYSGMAIASKKKRHAK